MQFGLRELDEKPYFCVVGNGGFVVAGGALGAGRGNYDQREPKPEREYRRLVAAGWEANPAAALPAAGTNAGA